MRINFLGSLLLVIFFLTACGKKTENSSSSPNIAVQKQEASPEGVYRVVLANTHPAAENASGAGTIRIDEEKIEVSLKMINLPKRTKLYQFINTAGECPKIEHDKNQDGVIDFEEMRKVAGEVLIPLDSDLTTQTEGLDGMPVSDGQGFYAYDEEASWEDFIQDLKRSPDEGTPFHKLSSDEYLNLARKSVLILKGTPAGEGSLPQAGILLACGRIVKIVEED